MNLQIRRALISVSKKEGLIDFAKLLHSLKVEIISTGNTAEFLKKENIPVQAISNFTGFPEILHGRVKTLHPKIHGGLLGRRNEPDHLKQMEENQILPIDLVIVNLYPFEETVAKKDCKLIDAIENIDIGGPSMIRSAAKNFESVAVVVDTADYERVMNLLKSTEGKTDLETRWYLAQKAFSHTAAYDGAISNYLTRVEKCEMNQVPTLEHFPKVYNLQATQVSTLRYGENPHQLAAYYRFKNNSEANVIDADCLHGKELSYNNLLDLDAALTIVKEFKKTACVIVKHNNPCGSALGSTLKEAFTRAKACDPVSAFGGIVAVNEKVDLEFVKEFNETFFEAIIAPDYESSALELLKSKKNLRILKTTSIENAKRENTDLKKITGGILLQDRDLGEVDLKSCAVVTSRAPTADEFAALDFAWKISKHVKSNAIVYAKNCQTIGIGAGQMSRVDSVKLGAMKSQQDLKGSVLASDAFFPFRDGVDEAAKYGITAIVQPGGSVRDEEVIQVANEHQIAMIFTKQRHFKH